MDPVRLLCGGGGDAFRSTSSSAIPIASGAIRPGRRQLQQYCTVAALWSRRVYELQEARVVVITPSPTR